MRARRTRERKPSRLVVLGCANEAPLYVSSTGHKDCCLRNGVNTIFSQRFAAWLLTTCRRRMHSTAQPSAISLDPALIQHTEPTATAQSDRRVLDATVGPSGNLLHDAGCRSCSARLRPFVVCEPIDARLHLQTRATGPPILLALTHHCGPWARCCPLPLGDLGFRLASVDGSGNEPPWYLLK